MLCGHVLSLFEILTAKVYRRVSRWARDRRRASTCTAADSCPARSSATTHSPPRICRPLTPTRRTSIRTCIPTTARVNRRERHSFVLLVLFGSDYDVSAVPHPNDLSQSISLRPHSRAELEIEQRRVESDLPVGFHQPVRLPVRPARRTAPRLCRYRGVLETHPIPFCRVIQFNFER